MCGEIGLAIAAYRNCTMRQVYNILKGYNKKTEAQYKTDCELNRNLAFYISRPYFGKDDEDLTPKEFLPMPWEKQPDDKPIQLTMSREQIKDHFKKIP